MGIIYNCITCLCSCANLTKAVCTNILHSLWVEQTLARRWIKNKMQVVECSLLYTLYDLAQTPTQTIFYTCRNSAESRNLAKPFTLCVCVCFGKFAESRNCKVSTRVECCLGRCLNPFVGNGVR